MTRSNTILLSLALITALAGLSCSGTSISLTANKTGDSGVYRSMDRGVHWEHKVFVERVKKKDVTIGSVNIKRFVMDPIDSRIVYILTNESGIWKTVDGGERWRQVYPGGAVGDLAVDPRDSNNLVVASGNAIAYSNDAGSTWVRVYLESRPGIGVNAVLIDRSNTKRVYAGTSAGDVLVTTDGGESWQVLHRFDGASLVRLVQTPSRLIFAMTPSQGFWRSNDEGVTWTNTIESLRDKPGAHEIREIVLDPTTPNGLFMVTNYGIFKSLDAGETWNEFTLIARPGAADIKSLTLNPIDAKEMYYAVPGGLYRSQDGGSNWTTLSLPVGHLPTAMIVDWYNPEIVYLGVTKVKK